MGKLKSKNSKINAPLVPNFMLGSNWREAWGMGLEAFKLRTPNLSELQVLYELYEL